MKVELFPFQKKALLDLRVKTTEAISGFHRTHTPQVVSFTAPTGAGKTLIMAALFEEIFYGDEEYPDQHEAIFVWLSDSPELNEQSKRKIDYKADRIALSQCVTVDDASFDQVVMEDGHIYFLNTQKLRKGGNLTRYSDTRQYTIWETLQNTIREKSDHFYFVIDEAHRGMQGREASRATTIMQKFIKGSTEDGIDAMPVVIGITATPERFNALVSSTTSTIHHVVVTADEVRSSGLLKDRIIITYPEDNSLNKDMAVLQAAADDWKNKWDHWYQYCYEQHHAHVNPILVIQVQNRSGSTISSTDLNDCLQKFEERTRVRLQDGEVVHCFGDTGSMQINGISVKYIDPSDIAEDKKVKIVFFKESLSTGWDCPRAETMMSFRHANDATYIAQLLGRMVRTPLQMHIQVDDSLNDVHLYLPYFNADTVKDVADALQDSEGGNIPTDVYGETMDEPVVETWSVHPRSTRIQERHQREETQTPGQQSLFDPNYADVLHGASAAVSSSLSTDADIEVSRSDELEQGGRRNNEGIRINTQEIQGQADASDDSSVPEEITVQAGKTHVMEESQSADELDRERIMRAINDSGLLSYDVRRVRTSNYLSSLYGLARLLTQSGKYPEAKDTVLDDIVKMIHGYADELRSEGKYAAQAEEIMQFRMKTQVFDAFGESVDNNVVHYFMSTTDADIDRQFQRAEGSLGREGVANRYGSRYCEDEDPNEYKIDVILFANNEDCMARLNAYAERLFHELNDRYRRRMVGESERVLRQYNSIVSDGDAVSKHNFRLPEVISQLRDVNGQDYTDHLFVDDSGTARINLNSWEEGVLREEQARDDFVCWFRNPPRKSWSLCIPYEMDGEQRPAYPDFVIIRTDPETEYVFDILEPHDPTRIDNLGKAKGFAEYARQNPGVGRIQLIRKSKDALGHDRFKRLDMARSLIRDKVSHAMTNDELDHIFETDGFFD